MGDHCLLNRCWTSWQSPSFSKFPSDWPSASQGHVPGETVPLLNTQTPRTANPESGWECGPAAPLPVSSSRFILLGQRWGKGHLLLYSQKAPASFMTITCLILQQIHAAYTMISSMIANHSSTDNEAEVQRARALPRSHIW